MSTWQLPDPEATRELGRRLAGVLKAGDLVVLTGDLGAGKTTLTQGIGAGLGVRGQVASPTFIIARAHPNLGEGPDLVHVDAYRLQSLAEVDALDLDSLLEDSVTVVEWGEGMVEGLAEDRLEIRVGRPRGGLSVDDEVADAGTRTVVIATHGPRWADVDLAAALGMPTDPAAGSDAGGQDAGTPDADGRDAGTPDAGGRDAGGRDARTPDAGGRDAGTPDVGSRDAGGRDARVAGRTDVGSAR